MLDKNFEFNLTRSRRKTQSYLEDMTSIFNEDIVNIKTKFIQYYVIYLVCKLLTYS